MSTLEDFEILGKIKELIPKLFMPKDGILNLNLSLENDLDLYGEDAVEFMLKYSEALGVDISEFDANKYFTQDSFWYTRIYKKLWISLGVKYKEELTIGDLVKAAKKRKIT